MNRDQPRSPGAGDSTRVTSAGGSSRPGAVIVAIGLACAVVATSATVIGMPSAQASDRYEIVAHRGGLDLAPESTLSAFDRAIAAGVDAIEFDVSIHQGRRGRRASRRPAGSDHELQRFGSATSPTSDFGPAMRAAGTPPNSGGSESRASRTLWPASGGNRRRWTCTSTSSVDPSARLDRSSKRSIEKDSGIGRRCWGPRRPSWHRWSQRARSGWATCSPPMRGGRPTTRCSFRTTPPSRGTWWLTPNATTRSSWPFRTTRSPCVR